MSNWLIYKASRGLCRLLLTIFYDYKAYGLRNVPRTGGCLTVANHESYLDPVLVGLQIPRVMAFMAKSELFENGIFGWYIRQLNAFPVRQGKGDIGAVRETIEILRNGNILNIFPEGSRTEDGKLQKIQSGSSLVIRKAAVPVVPAIIEGSYECWPRGRKLPRTGRIRVIYGPPMILHDLKPAEITARIQSAFEHLQQQLAAKIAEEDRPWQIHSSRK
jgi:1-acyl-sn-glycerol-3-phosphate acyltransferase